MKQICLDTIDSTNTYAKNHVHECTGPMTCIVAEEQTSGRGRYKRKWISPKGVNIYSTFVFKLDANTKALTSIALVMAYSLAKVLIREGFSPKIKWPNDLLIHGKKVSGILCETSFHKTHVDVFLGLGVNVNLDEKTATLIDQPATSLFIETKKQWDKNALLKKIGAEFEKDLNVFKQSGFAPFHSSFENLLAFLGEEIRCFDGKKEWIGVCHSIGKNGELNLLMPDHTIHSIYSGDLFPSE